MYGISNNNDIFGIWDLNSLIDSVSKMKAVDFVYLNFLLIFIFILIYFSFFYFQNLGLGLE